MLQCTTRRNSALASLLVLLGSAVLACGAAAEASDDADSRYDFSIPSQSLESALEQFSRITRRQVSVDSRLVDRLSSDPVSGRLTAEDALAAMTGSLGLEIVTIDEVDFALRASGESPGAPARSDYRYQQIEEIVVRGELLTRSLQNTQTSVSVARSLTRPWTRTCSIWSTVSRVSVPRAAVSAL